VLRRGGLSEGGAGVCGWRMTPPSALATAQAAHRHIARDAGVFVIRTEDAV